MIKVFFGVCVVMAKLDAAREIRRCVDTGKVIFGAKETENSLKNGSAKLVIIASNAPELVKQKLVSFAGASGSPFFVFSGSAIDLGSVCGKPFSVSSMAVLDAGKSKVLDLVVKQ